MLSQAMQIAVSESARQRINESLDIINTNLEYMRDYTICWFCKKRPAEDTAVHKVKMHGDVHRVGDQVQYRTLEWPVPRCGKCKSAHRVHSVMSLIFLVVGGIVGLVGGFIGVALGGGIGYGIGWLLGRLFTIGFKPESFGNQFPLVKKAELEGWVLGEKPQGVK